VEQALEQGQASGEFVLASPRQTAGVLWASLNGVLLLLDHPLRREIVGVPLDALFDSTLELLSRGLQATAAARSSSRVRKGAKR